MRQISIPIGTVSGMESQKDKNGMKLVGASKGKMADLEESSAGAYEHPVKTGEHFDYSNLQESGEGRLNNDAFFRAGKVRPLYSRQPSSLCQYAWTPRASFETESIEYDIDQHRFPAEPPNKPLPPLPSNATKHDYLAYRESSNTTGPDSKSIESYGNTRNLLLSRLPSSRDSAQSYAQLSIINADGSFHSQNLSEAESRELEGNFRARYAKHSVESNNKTQDALGEIQRSMVGQALDLGPGSSQRSSSIHAGSFRSRRSIPSQRSLSRPQTRRGFLFGRHAVDSMGVNSSSSEPQKIGKGSRHGRFARMIAASRLRRHGSPARRHASPIGRRGNSMRSLSSATRASARDDDDWETVDNGRPVAGRNMGTQSIKIAGGSSIADISDYRGLSQSGRSESSFPGQRLPQANFSENWSIMAEEHTGRTVLVSGSRMGITDVVPVTPTSRKHPRYHHPMPLPDDHVHPFNTFPPIISPKVSPSLPKSSSFMGSNYEDYSPIISDDDLATMGSNLNVTGTPNGTGARLVGSSLADFSSPGFETSLLSHWPSSPPEENISHNARISSQEWEDTLSSSESPTVRRNLDYRTANLNSQSGSHKSLPPLPDELVTAEGTVLNSKSNKSSSSGSYSGFSPTFAGEDLAMRFPHLLAIDVESPNPNDFRPIPSSPSEERLERMKRMRSNNSLKALVTMDKGPEAAVADSLEMSRIDPVNASNHDTVVTMDSGKISHISPARTPEHDAAPQGNANIPCPSSQRPLPYGTIRIFGDHARNVLADIRTPIARPVQSNRTPRQQARIPIVVEGSPHLHARPGLSSTDFQYRQIYLSRIWLMAFIIPFPMLIIMGHGMLDVLIEWQTHGEIIHFRKQEKIAALGLGYGLTLVLVIAVVVWWVASH